MAIEFDRTSPVLDNTSVDNIAQQQGVIDTLGALQFDMPDRDIIRSLNQQIDDSESYWNDAKGFDLKNARAENTRLHLGKIDESGLYKHQKQYKENQIFVAEESIVSYVTSQLASIQVLCGSKDPIDKLYASNFEKGAKCYFSGGVIDEVNLETLAELWTRDILNKRVAVGHYYYDKDLDEIILEHVDPEHIILDKNAALGKNPKFICHVLKRTPEELINEYPECEGKLLSRLGIQRKTPKQMTQELAVRKVWVTWYDKDNKAQEGCVTYFDNLVLNKYKNPNFLYTKKDLNIIKYPKKPYIFGNLVNYGTHMIDNTTPLEQAAEMQKYLMRRGRQIAENADKANGILVISTESGLNKDDGQNITGDPNQKLFVDTSNGKGTEQLVSQLQAQTLPDYVLEDKQDARMQIGNIMGAPTDFTGSQADDGDPTLGEVMIKKNQASGRQDMLVRAMSRMLQQAYQYYAQMVAVWYTDEHTFNYDAGDGEVDVITLKRELIPKGLTIKAGKPANPDRSRIEAIVLKLLNEKAISLLDAYKLLQLDNAQQLYDNWAKQSKDPMALARDALDVIDEADAFMAYTDIMDGKEVPVPANVAKEYILSLRKLMVSGTYENDKGDEVPFVEAPKKLTNKFVKFVNACIDRLEQQLALEEASDVGPPTGESLRPGAQLPDPNQPMPQPGGAPAGQPGTVAGPQMPGAMPPMGGQPPMGMPPAMGPQGLPPAGAPMPQPTPSSVFGGTPIPAPGQAPAPQPGNPGSLPMV